ncbi:MAG: response regulator transcription factor [Verrucomicrobia bacterium]|nr:response regulator transcription factor [Verrucomicrobiota bacterium]
MNPIRILLADDHTLVRAGIRSLLERMPDVSVIAEAANGREVLALVQSAHPNIVLMDIGMPFMNGLEATTRVLGEFPDVRVIILSMHMNEEYVLQAMRAGASGYLLKKAATAELETAIRAVARGATYLSPAFTKRVAEQLLEKGSDLKFPLEYLTPRQREILQLIAEGRNTKEIAAVTRLSAKTVEFHRAQLMDRLDIHDVPGLVRYAFGRVSCPWKRPILDSLPST